MYCHKSRHVGAYLPVIGSIRLPLAVWVTSPQSLQMGNLTDVLPFWISFTEVSDVAFRNPMFLKWEQTKQVLPPSYLKQQRWHVRTSGSLWCGLAVITFFPGTSGGMAERVVHGWGNFKRIWSVLSLASSLWAAFPLWVGSRTEGNGITWHTLYCRECCIHSTQPCVRSSPGFLAFCLWESLSGGYYVTPNVNNKLVEIGFCKALSAATLQECLIMSVAWGWKWNTGTHMIRFFSGSELRLHLWCV